MRIIVLLSCMILTYCSVVFANISGAGSNFLVISDIHLNSLSKTAMQINPSSSNIANNLDDTTFSMLLTKISQGINDGKIPRPQFIVFLGDMVGNYLGCDLAANIIAEESKIFAELKRTFLGIPIFYTFGNHDATSGANGPFYNDTPGYHSPYEIAKASSWDAGFLSISDTTEKLKESTFSRARIISEDTKNGYYSAYAQKNLRLIVLNTTMLSTGAINTTPNEADAQLNWLNEQMRSAEQAGDSVLIAMHVPFGNIIQNANPVNYLISSYNQKLLEIIGDYNDIIIGMIGGHEHLVELKVLNRDERAANFLINVPALATYAGNAPGFNTVHLSKSVDETSGNNKWLISDYDVFHFVANTETNPVLEKLYTFSDAYCKHHKHNTTGVLGCLQQLSANTIKDRTNFYHTGNPNFTLNLANPDNIFTTLSAIKQPDQSKQGFFSSSSSLLAPILIGVTSIAGAVTATALICAEN